MPPTDTGDFAEQLARAIHRGYVANARGRGETETANPSTVPWDRLPEDLRRANIAQAAAIGGKLRTIDAAVVPDGAGSTGFAFTDQEIELLARQEHDRWMRDRLAAGWTMVSRATTPANSTPTSRTGACWAPKTRTRTAKRSAPSPKSCATGYSITRLHRAASSKHAAS